VLLVHPVLPCVDAQDCRGGEATGWLSVQAHAKWAFGDKGCEGCPPDSRVTITLSLEAVKSVKFIDPDHKGEIVKTILHNGAAYHTPNNYAAVTVSWTATLQDGTKFDEVCVYKSLLFYD
jgi:hypothetical protein